MLRSFLYLDEQTLTDYISALEDGLREGRTESSGSSGSRTGGVDLKVASGGLSGGHDESASIASADNAPARFARLLSLAPEVPDRSGWTDIVTLNDLSGAGRGAFVDFECELHIPDVARMMNGTELNSFLDLVESFSGLGSLLGEVEGMPSPDELAGVRAFANMTKDSGLIVVGEDDESEWRCAGLLKRDLIRGDLADLPDFFRIAGKVGRPIRRGERKPLMALPGMSILPREQRRELERKKPDPGEEDMYLEGPACMIDILAIYR